MIDETTWELARETNGYFSEEEAGLLSDTVHQMPPDGVLLEVGSYFGRSTRFALAALGPDQRIVSVDAFVTRAGYSGHSYWDLADALAYDSRVRVLPMTLAQAYRHLRAQKMDVVFVDGDHSYLGATSDLCFGIALSRPGGLLLAHDVDDVFPGVIAAVESAINAGIIRPIKRTGSLALYEITDVPAWLLLPDSQPGREQRRRPEKH